MRRYVDIHVFCANNYSVVPHCAGFFAHFVILAAITQTKIHDIPITEMVLNSVGLVGMKSIRK
jgi:hypothetical protein